MGTVATSSRTRESVTMVAGLLAAAFGLATVADGLRHIVISSDTQEVVSGVDSALAHLRHGQLLGWGGAYPLLQAIPAFVLRAVGISSEHVIDALVGLNVLSFAAMVWASWRGLVRETVAGALLLVVVLVSGTMLWYLHATLAEPLAAAVTLGAAMASWHGRRHLLAAAFVFLAGISKDTAALFVLMLCLGASAGAESWSDASWRWRRVAWLLAAAGLSFLVTSAYNYARFGTILDLPYMASFRYVPWLETQAGFFAVVWLSPNGGLLPFWPSLTVLLVLAVVAAVRTIRKSAGWEARLLRAAPALGVAAALFGMTVELAKWFAPLGWVAWGSRLMLPWVPASAYLLVAAYHTEIIRLLRWTVLRPLLAWLAGIALTIASVPQYVAMVRPTLFIEMFTPDAACPRIPYAEQGASYYYACSNHLFWTKGSVLLTAFQVDGAHLVDLAIGCVCGAGLLWLLTRLPAPVGLEAL
jgi:hypothetical protein